MPFTADKNIYTHTFADTNQVEVTLRTYSRKVSFLFEANPGEVAEVGTDGSAATLSDRIPVGADEMLSLQIAPGRSHPLDAKKYYLKGVTSSKVTIIQEQ